MARRGVLHDCLRNLDAGTGTYDGGNTCNLIEVAERGHAWRNNAGISAYHASSKVDANRARWLAVAVFVGKIKQVWLSEPHPYRRSVAIAGNQRGHFFFARRHSCSLHFRHGPCVAPDRPAYRAGLLFVRRCVDAIACVGGGFELASPCAHGPRRSAIPRQPVPPLRLRPLQRQQARVHLHWLHSAWPRQVLPPANRPLRGHATRSTPTNRQQLVNSHSIPHLRTLTPPGYFGENYRNSEVAQW